MSLREQVRLSVDVQRGKLPRKEHGATMKHAEDSGAETLLAQVENMAAQADNAGRTKILEKLQNLSYSLETSDDTAKRLLYNVSVMGKPLSPISRGFSMASKLFLMTVNCIESSTCGNPHWH